MRIRCLAAAVILSTSPAAAQTWAEAVRAGDYETAAKRLHPLIVEQAVSFRLEPEPFRQLATMYAQGQGVVRDPVIACTLADLAARGQDMALSGTDDFAAHEARVKASRDFLNTLCNVLTAEERLAAGRALGCFMFGMPEDILSLGPDRVRIGRLGIRPADEGAAPPVEIPNCPQLIARARAVTVDRPWDAGPAYHRGTFWRFSVGSCFGPAIPRSHRPAMACSFRSTRSWTGS